MPAKLTTSQFIQRANKIHSGKYDYSLTQYINSCSKVTIICPIHTKFVQTPNNHLAGKGCNLCADINRKVNNQTTTAQFINQAKKVHKNKYDYSFVQYVNSWTQVKIICPAHTAFTQLPSNHLAGKGCPKCKNTQTSIRCKHNLKKFIDKAQKVHGDLYNYSKVNYKLDNQKVVIICKEHGEFKQVVRSHLSGNGCPRCAGFNVSFEEFVQKSNAVHKNKYDYSVAEKNYTGVRSKVVIVCPIHGKFKQSPGIHLHGVGCFQCGKMKAAQKRTLTTEEFSSRSKLIHNNFYDYSKTQYIGNKKNVVIVCPKHGEFEQSAGNHFMGKGCPKCVGKISKGEIEVVDFLKSLNVKVQTNVRNIIPPKELDIVLPEHKIAIEYNGLYWHSSAISNFNKFAHKTKSDACQKVGYRLIHIFSDDWKFKKEIIKSILKIQLMKVDFIFYARKCTCKAISNREAFAFLDRYHLQGAAPASHYLGLYSDGLLLQVMTFKKTGKQGQFTLGRFASMMNSSIVGGAGKLFSYFCANIPFLSIDTFCDLSMFSGKLYSHLGFTKVKEIAIDYSYVYNGVRKHKFGFRRKRLQKLLPNFDINKSELWNTINNNIYRIYDCGKIKYKFSK